MTNGTPPKSTRKRSSKTITSSGEPPSGGQGDKRMTEISIPGQKDTAAVGERPATELGVGVTVKDAVRIGAMRSDEAPVTVSAADDDLVEFQLDGGAVIWMRGDEVHERLGTGPARGADATGVVSIDPSLPIDDRTRGFGFWAIEAAFSPYAFRIDMASQDRTVRIWRLLSFKSLVARGLPARSGGAGRGATCGPF